MMQRLVTLAPALNARLESIKNCRQVNAKVTNPSASTTGYMTTKLMCANSDAPVFPWTLMPLDYAAGLATVARERRTRIRSC